MKSALVTLLASLLIGLSPLVSVLLASLFAGLNGCRLHEGFPNPCVFLGIDFGEMLYSMAVAGWYIFFTVPIGIIGVVISLFMFIYFLFKKWISTKAK